MELAHHHRFIHRPATFTLFTSSSKPLSKPTLCFCNSTESPSPRLALAQSLQSDTLKILEWSSICRQLSPFTSTSMGLRATENAELPIGETLQESRKLLQQTSDALSASASGPWDFSGIEDVSPIIDSSVNGDVLTVREICTVRRMLVAAGKILEKLEAAAAAAADRCVESSDWYSSLLLILHGCDFQIELVKKIQFCIDSNLSVILDRASEDLEIIRYERRRNMEELDSLLKQVSSRIFRSGGFDKPLVTKRRSRMCVGVRASYKHLLPGGIVLDVSSSGATYFMEPKDVVELNNMEVRLSSAEKAEEIAILSLLTSEIADSGTSIRDLLGRFREIDLAFARAAYARHLDGVCPIFSSEGLDSSRDGASFSVDIQSLQHPLLLNKVNEVNGALKNGSSSINSTGPVPIDIKIQCGTRVVVISGPNTGGKTASMKTLGLASLMSKAGLFLPAKNLPRLPWFNLVLADIGDHQSLEQNLSTFSGHISRIRDILQVASKESLVLLDEIGSGTDPSEGVALSTSILQYLKDCVNLAMVTTHYADLTLLKEKDRQFENAAMEFSIETLKPTYRILWGSSGDSNALSIAKSIGFDENIIERAKKWVEKLKPERQQERKGLVYQSLLEERNRLEAQAVEAASIHVNTMDIYTEIFNEAKDIDSREKALMATETKRIRQELKLVQSKIDSVVTEFENQLRIVTPDQFNGLIRKSESALASIVEAYQPNEPFEGSSKSNGDSKPSYTPEYGEQVYVKGLGNKLATVVADDGDNAVLVQYGKVRVRVNKTDIRAVAKNTRKDVTARMLPQSKRQGRRSREYEETNKNEEVSYGPVIQTSKNSVDLRGMRVEEAAFELDIAISSRPPNSVLFIVHGMGTGAVKERAIEILKSHPRVVKFEQESPVNYGCTVAYIRHTQLRRQTAVENIRKGFS